MKKKAQAVTEYVMLIVVVAAAIIAMNLYIQRAANDRLHNIELETNPAVDAQGVLGEKREDETPDGEPGGPGERQQPAATGTGQQELGTVNLDGMRLPYSG